MAITKKIRDFFEENQDKFKDKKVYVFSIALLFFCFYLLVLSFDPASNKVSFLVGQVSDRDIIAPNTISYIDEKETLKIQHETLANIADVYDLDVGITDSSEKQLRETFRTTDQIISSLNSNKDSQNTADTNTHTQSADQAVESLSKNLPISLPNNVVATMLSLDETSRFKCEENIKFFLYKYLQQGIRENEVDKIKQQILTEIEKLDLSQREKIVVVTITNELIRANFIYNSEETQKRKDNALKDIKPVRKTVKKDQVIVRKGDIVTPEQISVMEKIGLHTSSSDTQRIAGNALFIVLMMGAAMLYLFKFSKTIYDSRQYLALIWIIIFITVILAKVSSYLSIFIAPIALGSILAAVLLNSRIAILVCIIVAMFMGVISEEGLRPIAMALFGGLAGIYGNSVYTRGHSLIRAGVFVAFVNFSIIISTGLIYQLDNTQILTDAIYGIIGGILAAIMSIGLLPFFENSFNITSTTKLVDLTKPSNPLLQRLLLEAPGTYHHSIIIGNMAETAATAVKANSILTRVGAYYHDVGKLKRPYFFAENQIAGENPHDEMAPYLSNLVINSHVDDGVELCKEYNLPEVIINFVREHHGTTLASFFYQKALSLENSEKVSENDFRYKGPKPQSKETAILMLADSCEASVRSLDKPTYNKIQMMVRKIIKARLDDGQLDECDLTLKDLTVIGNVFVRILSSMFHTRVEYPQDLNKKEKEDNNENSNK
ncbi:HDIG domain-containing protein [Selenomonadales bacterium OttesenSCG-928-I06]|nr:HDIG domain-containing protein [Selenomonadales bacterium OttesenSCG-928-I06]